VKFSKQICRTVAAFGLLLIGIVAVGHHGVGGYDVNNPMTLTGVITAVEMVNPHSFIYIDVKTDGGKIEHWALEGSPPNVLNRTGAAKEVKPGIVVTVTGYPPRDSSRLAEALSYSSRAVEQLKAGHVLQAGDMKMPDGSKFRYGMGPAGEPLK